MKRFIIERSADEFYTSHSGLALVGLGINRFTSLNTKLEKGKCQIKCFFSAVAESGMLCA